MEVIASFENQTITVKLKNGTNYLYPHLLWDYEDHDPGTCQRVKDAIKHNSATFTKVENPPVFPGGVEAWEKYINEFCAQHKKEIKKIGSAEIYLQFIVHLHGQVTEVEIISNDGTSNHTELAIEAMKKKPRLDTRCSTRAYSC